ncbi:MAG: hypothetical protein ACR2J1_03910 [Methyloceanibacter sp.]|uniref:hypothetical protein n=1 Tax=Methyloceanibacter sp. TaxID=1965321 RepID=UPI003D9B0E58
MSWLRLIRSENIGPATEFIIGGLPEPAMPICLRVCFRLSTSPAEFRYSKSCRASSRIYLNRLQVVFVIRCD